MNPCRKYKIIIGTKNVIKTKNLDINLPPDSFEMGGSPRTREESNVLTFGRSNFHTFK